MSHPCPWCGDPCECGAADAECDHDCEPIDPTGLTAADIAPCTADDAPYLLPDASEDDDETCDFGHEDVVT